MRLVFSLIILLHFSFESKSQSLLSKSDLSFLEELTRSVLDSSRIRPGEVISPDFGPNNTGGALVRPGGRTSYPSFWIRDYAMSIKTFRYGIINDSCWQSASQLVNANFQTAGVQDVPIQIKITSI